VHTSCFPAVHEILCCQPMPFMFALTSQFAFWRCAAPVSGRSARPRDVQRSGDGFAPVRGRRRGASVRVSRVLSACECRRHRSCCPRRLAGLSVLLCAGFCTALPVSHIAHGTKRRSSERGRRPCALVVTPQERACLAFSCTSEPGAVDGCVSRFIARCCLLRARACNTSAAVYCN